VSYRASTATNHIPLPPLRAAVRITESTPKLTSRRAESARPRRHAFRNDLVPGVRPRQGVYPDWAPDFETGKIGCVTGAGR
jgi:hypothetical protein